MGKYIDADRLKAEIERLAKTYQDSIWRTVKGETAKDFRDKLLSIIDSLQQENPEEQPEYGYLSTEYVCGKKSRWNVGDILAYYLCTSNEEGEMVIGKIVNVEFDDEEGWIYTFEDEGTSDEQSLIEQGVYKIIENGK